MTRVNSEIWQSLNSFRKKADLRLANLQQAFQKATFATLTNADKLFEIPDVSGPVKKGTAYEQHRYCGFVRACRKWDIYFAAGTNATRLKTWVPCSLLLRDEVLYKISFWRGPRQKQVRDVKETHRIGNTVGSFKGHSRGGYRRDSWFTKKESHYKGAGSSHARPPFLGKGTRPNSRKKLPYQKNGSPAGKK